jgi:hypothetical protein
VASERPEEIAEIPRQLANVPPDISGIGAPHVVVRAFADDIREIKRDQKADFRIVIGMFGAGFVAVAGMLIYGYFRIDDRITKLEDKVDVLGTTLTRVDTKLGDLLERIPPIQSPAPHR